jgi:hypothetical protein
MLIMESQLSYIIKQCRNNKVMLQVLTRVTWWLKKMEHYHLIDSEIILICLLKHNGLEGDSVSMTSQKYETYSLFNTLGGITAVDTH